LRQRWLPDASGESPASFMMPPEPGGFLNGDCMISSVSKEKFEDYEGFVEKFKPKKTTDDCMTPENIYDCVADYVAKRYGLSRESFVRPFWPGGDYQAFDYPDGGCVVVDNPPFSILTKILDFYEATGRDYFLFAPSLTGLSLVARHKTTFICCGVLITYENGASVNTAFVTSLEPGVVMRTDPELHLSLAEVNKINLRHNVAELPVYEYPDYVITGALAQKYAKRGIEFVVPRNSAVFIRRLDSQAGTDKTIFGGGLLLSDKAAADKAAADKAAADKAAADKAAADKAATIYWPLSDRERELVDGLT